MGRLVNQGGLYSIVRNFEMFGADIGEIQKVDIKVGSRNGLDEFGILRIFGAIVF